MHNNITGTSLEIAESLVAAIRELSVHAPDLMEGYESELEGFCAAVDAARSGFPLVLEERISQRIDRLSGVLLGPVFTSDRHPWPIDEVGKPMAPLCQLNTDECPRQISDTSGLIQVWLSESSSPTKQSLIRVIPMAEATAEAMTPIIKYEQTINALLPDAAEWLPEAHQAPKITRKQYITEEAGAHGCATSDELEDKNWDEWMRLAEEYGEKFGDDPIPCWQIIGFDRERIYCDISLDQKKYFARLKGNLAEFKEDGSTGREKTIELMASISHLFDRWIEICGANLYPCLFGTFDAIQYSAAERDEPIVCFESIGQREWGDGGNAQVFFSKENGFYFDWSCA
jgi:hypothetical protein